MRAAFAVKAALAALLENAAAGRYRVEGVQKRKLDSKNVMALPSVTVYYDQGSFPEGKSSINGPYQHAATLRVDIVTAAEAEMDLEPLTKGGTPEEIAAALAAKTDAEAVADAKSDEIAAVLFDIIMKPQNRNLGLDYNPGRWITEYKKGQPQAVGALVVLAGYFTISICTPEYVTDEAGTPGTEGIHSGIGLTPDIAGDTREGVAVAAPL
jgi:hypothetical protein